MTDILLFAGGVLFGALVVLVVHVLRKKDTREIARALVSATEAEKIQDLEALLGRVRDSFGALSQEALKASTGELLKLARENLDGRVNLGEKDLESKKQLIDQNLSTMKGDIHKMQELVSRFESERARQYGELDVQLKTAARETSRLQDTADHLRQALVSTKARGQWGERMAEDVLRLAGFVEGVNYIKQKVLDMAASRPDYTFWLPQGLKVNMDVKFPLNSYLRYLEADNESARETHKTQFLRDVRTRIKALKKEQEFLLFQRTLAAADSKYLILDLRTGKGMLKYRGRILRTFNCPLAGKRLPAAFPKKIVTLTGKVDGSPGTRQLVFTDPLLIIQSKHVSTGKAKSKEGLRIMLGTKDLGAIFFALEKGSLAYIRN